MDIGERLAEARERLSPAERRVAEVVLARPEAIAFGTVASLASEASTSGPTVVRTATKLGYDGFVALQAAVQEELAGRLRPAAAAIRTRPAPDPLRRSLEIETSNVHDTLAAVDPAAFDEVTRSLADRGRRVAVLSGEATLGPAHVMADALGMLRPGVQLFVGTEVRVVRQLALLDPRDVLVAIDLRRYERWVLEAAERAAAGGLTLVAITDGLLSPLAAHAAHVFVVNATGAGPFDSHVGTMALCNALVAGTAARLRRTATARLDRVERLWAQTGALVDR
ncbi:MAG TPA: MurR/RpiR family transcriptional regulator [Actinomycetota bacterium]|nr:MurR/RpiR family transcriptional regulator [Actinomycetota bacterium]